MRAQTRALLAAQGGVAAVADLARAGESSDTVDRLVARKELVRIRRGAVVDGHLWARSPSAARHRLRALAVLRALDPREPGSDSPPRFALSHHSALSVGGVPVYGVDEVAHLVRVNVGGGWRGVALQVHPALPRELLTTMDGFLAEAGYWSVPVEHACLQVADAFGQEAGLVSTDAALHHQRLTRDQLRTALAQIRAGRGQAAARDVVDLADASSESVGESRTRWLLHLLGLPLPVPQARIRDAEGRVIARVDFLFAEQRTIVEFDGAVKYDGAGGRRALVREKAREDALRALGYQVVRLTWADLARPERVRMLVLRAFARASAA